MKLRDYVEARARGQGGAYRALLEVYEAVDGGRLRLLDPDPPRTFPGFLVRPAYSMWLHTALALLAATLAVIPLSAHLPWLLPARYVLGSLYVLFLPGYSLVEALYPNRGDLTPLERLALSIGLSLAVVPLVGLVLNYTPWGIRLEPYVAASSTLITGLLLAAAYRKYRALRAALAGRQLGARPAGAGVAGRGRRTL